MQEEFVYYSLLKSKAGQRKEGALLHAIIQGPRPPPSCSSDPLKVLRVLAIQREGEERENTSVTMLAQASHLLCTSLPSCQCNGVRTEAELLSCSRAVEKGPEFAPQCPWGLS